MKKDYDGIRPIKVCPICKNNFIPAPQHIWKIKSSSYHFKLVCSYKCMREFEKQKEGKKKCYLTRN